MQQFAAALRSIGLTVVIALVVPLAATETFAAGPPKPKKLQQVTAADKQAAAKRAAALGLQPGVAGLAGPTPPCRLPGIEGPGGVSHYFGPYGNWAYSPLPRVPSQTSAVDPAAAGTPLRPSTIADAYGTGPAMATAAATVDAIGDITAITVTDGGAGLQRSRRHHHRSRTGGGAAARRRSTRDTLTGGMRKFVDGMPMLGPTGANNLGQYIPVGDSRHGTADRGGRADYYEIALVEYAEQMHSDLPPTRLRGYVQLATPGRRASLLLGGYDPS